MQLLRAVSPTGMWCTKHVLQKARGAQEKASHPSEHAQLLIHTLAFPVISSLLALPFAFLNAYIIWFYSQVSLSSKAIIRIKRPS